MIKSNNLVIITYHRGINYGGFLQAYSLQSFFRKRGLNVYFLNLYSYKEIIRDLYYAVKTKNILRLTKNCIKVLKFFFLRKKYFKEISLKECNRSFINCPIIFGSDELWNIENPIFVNNNFKFFGNNVISDKKYTYAISIGNSSYKKLDQNFVIKESLNHFKHISVRDGYTKKFIESHISDNITHDLDPTYLIKPPSNTVIHQKYILIYSTLNLEKYSSMISDFAKSNDLSIYSIGYHCEFADKNILTEDPFGYLKYIQSASYVITSMFHGFSYCIHYKKKFGLIKDDYRFKKMDDMLDMLDIKKRLIEPNHDFEYLKNLFVSTLDYNAINTRLEKLKQKSIEYLNSIIDSQ